MEKEDKLIHRYLGRGGIIARDLKGYEYRPEQLEMASRVFEALLEKRFLIVEAGTGTGKTLAYLLPAILSNKLVVISTFTKNLQEQIFYKDIPLLKKHFSFKVCLMKGRGNYLCQRKLFEIERRPGLDFVPDKEFLTLISNWANRTKTGDRDELEALPDSFPLWDRVCADADSCFGRNCAFFSSCFITKLRQRAQSSDLLIVNHHLFFADLSLRYGGFGEVIPRYRAVIFDEAHNLEEVATEYFGISISDFQIVDFIRECFYYHSELPDKSRRELRRGLELLRSRVLEFFDGLKSELIVEDSSELRRIGFSRNKFSKDLQKKLDEMFTAMGVVCSCLSGLADLAVFQNLFERSNKLFQNLSFLLREEERGFVYFVEPRVKSLSLRALPLEVSSIFKRFLYPNLDSSVFTSATLTCAEGGKQSFNYFRARTGLDELSSPVLNEIKLESSFDWKKQAILYLPKGLPDPNSRTFVDKAFTEVEKLLQLSKGRAFLLFTSYRNMDAFYERVREVFDYPLLKQGDKPRHLLLEDFRRLENSVLFGTMSFWQGVDVVGPSLSMVIIDRLPFDVPNDPLIEARINFLNSRGEDAFKSYQLPSAVIMLRQGLGRLIRSKKDFGVLCVLDPRIRTRWYGKIFIESLPGVQISSDLEEVRKFLGEREQLINNGAS